MALKYEFLIKGGTVVDGSAPHLDAGVFWAPLMEPAAAYGITTSRARALSGRTS